jgi:hypothetical protein
MNIEKYASYNGNDSYTEIPNKSKFNFKKPKFTIECYVRFNDVDKEQRILSKTFHHTNYGYSLGIVSKKLWFTTYSFHDFIGTKEVLKVNKWYHILVVVKKGKVKFYLNEKFIEEVNGKEGLVDNSYPLNIGRMGNSTYYLNGDVAIVKFYNKKVANPKKDIDEEDESLVFELDYKSLKKYTNNNVKFVKKDSDSDKSGSEDSDSEDSDSEKSDSEDNNSDDEEEIKWIPKISAKEKSLKFSKGNTICKYSSNADAEWRITILGSKTENFQVKFLTNIDYCFVGYSDPKKV